MLTVADVEGTCAFYRPVPGMEIVVDGYQAKDGTNKAVGRSLMFADGRKFLLGNMEPAGRGGPQR